MRERLRDAARRLSRADALRPLDDEARRASLLVARALRRIGPPARRRGHEALSGFYPGRPILLGHRGAMAVAPENTLGSFRRAVEDGADGVELDVQLSSDLVPVVLHDDTLDRTTDGQGPAAHQTAAALSALDAGSWFPGWGRERVPTLEEALAALPDGKVCNVEIKGPTPRGAPLERHVVDGIARHRDRLKIIVSSFHPSQLLRVRRLDPSIPIGLLFEGAAPWPLRTAWPATVLLPEAVHPQASLVDQAFVIAAHKAGMRVHAWAVRSEEEAERLLSIGTDGLIVDDVAAMRRVCERAHPLAYRAR